MTAMGGAPCGWSADLCQADSGCRGSGARASSTKRLNLDGVRELLLHVDGVGDHQDLSEPSAETGQRTEEPIAVLTVERTEHLVEHQQTNRSARQQVDLFANGDPQRQVGQIGLRTGVPVERMTGAADPQLEGVAVD